MEPGVVRLGQAPGWHGHGAGRLFSPGSVPRNANPRLFTPQCRVVKITIRGDEGVPVQVDGEAWIQPPGIIKIQHKNRAQMLTRDRVSSGLHSPRRGVMLGHGEV